MIRPRQAGLQFLINHQEKQNFDYLKKSLFSFTQVMLVFNTFLLQIIFQVTCRPIKESGGEKYEQGRVRARKREDNERGTCKYIIKEKTGYKFMSA